MATSFPQFSHIHCSSRFDRSAASLESDLDDWRTRSSLITLTEVANDARGATLREQGWGYFRSTRDAGRDECGTCWDLDKWSSTWTNTVKLNNAVFYNLRGKPAAPVYASTVLLKRKSSGHKLMISVTHMPAHVEGPNHWRTTTVRWQARKAAYLSSLKNWGVYVANQQRRLNPDATMVVSDWNLNLKRDWVRAMLHDRFPNLHQAWIRFPTSGGSLAGGPVAPLGAPGRGYGDRIIDGTLYNGLTVTAEPNLLARVKSSDHRPYHETFKFKSAADHPGTEDAVGDTGNQDVWWGFGDYQDDEIYEVQNLVPAGYVGTFTFGPLGPTADLPD